MNMLVTFGSLPSGSIGCALAIVFAMSSPALTLAAPPIFIVVWLVMVSRRCSWCWGTVFSELEVTICAARRMNFQGATCGPCVARWRREVGRYNYSNLEWKVCDGIIWGKSLHDAAPAFVDISIISFIFHISQYFALKIEKIFIKAGTAGRSEN